MAGFDMDAFNFHMSKIEEIVSSDVQLDKRYNLYPIKNEKSFQFYKKLEANNWSANEINCDQTDKDDYENMSERERKPLELVLAFFSSADGIIVDNLAFRFILEAKTLEDRCFFIEQLKNELVHAETYSKILFHLVSSEEKRKELFSHINTKSIIGEIDAWIKKWIFSNEHISLRYLAFACTEWTLFQGGFTVIFSYRKDGKGRLKNVTVSNQLISRDEALHSEYGAEKHLETIPTFETNEEKERYYEKVNKIIDESRELSYRFGNEMYDLEVCGIDDKSYRQYIEFITDKLRNRINLPSVYNVENPFPWMELVSLNEKSNFFEVKVSSYKNFSLKEENDTVNYEEVDF